MGKFNTLSVVLTLLASTPTSLTLDLSVCLFRATAILAYLPQELLGTSFYEYFHHDDINHLAECHRQGTQSGSTSACLVQSSSLLLLLLLNSPCRLCHTVLQMREKINTNCYKFKIKDGSFITLRSRWFSFMNPWTKEVEYIVSTNTVVS